MTTVGGLLPRHRAARAGGVLLLVALVTLAVPLVLGDFSVQLTALFLPFAILALSVDVLWGENKLISFGHGAFFALGGYVGGLVLLGHSSSVAGGGATSLLEAAPKTSGLDRTLDALNAVQIAGIPIAALLLPALVAGAVGLLVGLVVFRAAAPEVYLPLITLGIGVVAGIWFNGLDVLGGSNGLSGIPGFVGDDSPGGSSSSTTFLFNAVFVIAAFGGYWLFRRSQRGWTWRALGDDPVRLEALGYPVRRMRAYGFGISCAIAGVAGALYAATAGFMAPSVAGVGFSAQILIWVAVGGVGTLLGPLVGALLVKWGEQWLSSDLGLQDSWQAFLGLVLVLVVVAAPRGLLGALGDRSARDAISGIRGRRRRERTAGPDGVEPTGA